MIIKHTNNEPVNHKIYISGPITNVENWQTAFIDAESALEEYYKDYFFSIENPLRIARRIESAFALAGAVPEYVDYMREDISTLVDCGTICMLPGWKRSKGARMEYRIAKILNMIILEYKPD